MKKNILTLVLTIVMLGCVFPISAVYAENVNATKTASKVLVDGVSQSFDAYNISGNNYFKLRDIAFILNGTSKQFEVSWNGEKNAISLTSGKTYTAVGGEMQVANGRNTKTAATTNAKIYLNGKEVSFTAYNIEGNNYFKLRDLGSYIDFGVDWNGKISTVEIWSTKGYTPESNENSEVDNSIIELPSIEATVKLSELYTEDGTGDYLGFSKLKGYSGYDKFAVYFKGTSGSYQVSVIDLRGLNDNELVTWKYNGRVITNTRIECNYFFSDLSYLKSKFNLTDDIISSEWLHSTFGQVYWDWAVFLGFTSDAERMVGKYLNAIEGIDYNNRYVNFDEMQYSWVSGIYFEKTLINSKNLQSFGIVGVESGIPGYVYVYAFPEIPYYVDEMTDKFMLAKNAMGVFNGIRMKKEDGILWFDYNDVKEKGIYKLSN